MPSKKLILIMIDGVSADYFDKHMDRLPNLARMAEGGFWVMRMRSPVPGVSLTGRASYLTGLTADQHGIYGNRLKRPSGFTPSEADDMRTPSIVTYASASGLEVASIGHALVNPADTSVYVPPCWMRGDGFTKVTIAGKDVSLLAVKDPDNRLASATPPFHGNDDAMGPSNYRIADEQMIAAAALLLGSERSPDFVITEINITDSAQHFHGYESPEAHDAAVFADRMIGLCLNALKGNPAGDQYNFAILSDHGHEAISKSIYVDRLLPGMDCDAEGSTLHVFVKSAADRALAGERLASVGATEIDRSYLPADIRDGVAAFVAPTNFDFATAPADAPQGAVTGASFYKSMHGLMPGNPSDDRFCLFFGPDVPKSQIDVASAESFAPTVGALLGLDPSHFPEGTLFVPAPASDRR